MKWLSCILLKTLAFPCHYTYIVPHFQEEPKRNLLNIQYYAWWNIHKLWELAGKQGYEPFHLTCQLEMIRRGQLPAWCVTQNWFRFVGGTVQRIPHPKYNRRIMHSRDHRGGGAGRAIALQLFCLDWLFRAPDDMGNMWILPLESNKMCLLLDMRFTKAKARQSCVAAVVLTGVPTVWVSVHSICLASEDVV